MQARVKAALARKDEALAAAQRQARARNLPLHRQCTNAYLEFQVYLYYCIGTVRFYAV